jgi:hypothetical protein
MCQLIAQEALKRMHEEEEYATQKLPPLIYAAKDFLRFMTLVANRNPTVAMRGPQWQALEQAISDAEPTQDPSLAADEDPISGEQGVYVDCSRIKDLADPQEGNIAGILIAELADTIRKLAKEVEKLRK